MIPAFIVLTVIACGLGGFIAYAEIRGRKSKSKADAESAESAVEDTPQITDSEAESETDEAEVMETDYGMDDEITQIKTVVENGNVRYIVIKYSKSFLAKLIQSDDETKWYYSQLKNRLCSYDGVKSRISWKWESFRSGKKTLAKLRLRGKTLSLCLALNADDYADSKYKVESLAEIKAYADTPCMYRIKNDRRLKYGGELIDELMAQNGIAEIQHGETDYAQMYPYETTEKLIELKLIKELTDEEAQSGTMFKPSELRQSVSAQEVDALMQDEVAATLIESEDGVSDRTKQSIVNVDTLSQCFENGEVVTLDEIKKRVKGFNKNTTYLKVLARGTLDKSLTVEADGFSLQAVKMIVLTGGTVIKSGSKSCRRRGIK